MILKMKEDYIAYEYLSINVNNDLEPMYIDCYENFGWIPINKTGKRDYYINSNPKQNLVNIKFKRNRKIKEKEKLNVLQKKCEENFKIIDKLEKTPDSKGTMYSLIEAFIATVFIAISVFAITGEKVVWFPAIFCGTIGIIGWITPYFIYKKIKEKWELKNKAKIEEQYDIIYSTCEQARNILIENE